MGEDLGFKLLSSSLENSDHSSFSIKHGERRMQDSNDFHFSLCKDSQLPSGLVGGLQPGRLRERKEKEMAELEDRDMHVLEGDFLVFSHD